MESNPKKRGWIPHFIKNKFAKNQISGQFSAAVVSIDFIGFTALTERFMQDSFEGAEQLSESLNQVFAPLVKYVAARGGIIPLFAGDAFQSIFPFNPDAPGDEVHQALETAEFMRRFFDTHGGYRLIETPGKEIELSARIGVSHGEIHWGIPQRDGLATFYFRGKGISQSIQCQTLAEAGQIVIDSQIYDRFDRQLTATELIHDHKPFFILENVPIPDNGSSSSIQNQPLSKLDLEAFNLAFAPQLKSAEFRDVAVVFLSFDEKSEKRKLIPFLAAALKNTVQYGGYFHQVDISDKGGMILMLFGAPTAHENNSQRALESLLNLQALNFPIKWQAGMSWGTVWAGIRGGQERCEYAAVGDVVNTAARVATRAATGQIWVTDAVQAQLEDQYQFLDLGATRVKGKSQPMILYQLARKKDFHNKQQFDHDLVGRKGELNQLQALISPIYFRVNAGIIYVRGEAGIGKSRLIYQLREQVMHDRDVEWFFCPANEILGRSLHPFRYFLKSYFGQLGRQSIAENTANFATRFDRLCDQLSRSGVSEMLEEVKRIRPIIAAALGLHSESELYRQLDPKLRFQNLIAAIKTFFIAKSHFNPIIIHLEDAQWIDEDSRFLIKELTHNVAQIPIAIVCGARPLDDGQPFQLELSENTLETSLSINALSPQHVNTMAERLLGAPLSSSMVSLLVEKSGGNPFFLEQLCLDLKERG